MMRKMSIIDWIDLLAKNEDGGDGFYANGSEVYLEVLCHCLDKVLNMADYGRRCCQEGSGGYAAYERIKSALGDALADIQYYLDEWGW